MLNCEYISVIFMVLIYLLTNGSDVKICIVTFMQHVLASSFNIVIFIKLTLPSKYIELILEVASVM